MDLELTFYVGSGGEETALAGQDCEDGVGVVVKFSERSNGVDHEIAPERVEGLRSIELQRGSDLGWSLQQ